MNNCIRKTKKIIVQKMATEITGKDKRCPSKCREIQN